MMMMIMVMLRQEHILGHADKMKGAGSDCRIVVGICLGYHPLERL
jgi:hypothetical protein